MGHLRAGRKNGAAIQNCRILLTKTPLSAQNSKQSELFEWTTNQSPEREGEHSRDDSKEKAGCRDAISHVTV